MSSQNGNPTQAPRDPDLAGAEAAMHRAAQRARQRAEAAARIAGTPDHSMEDSGGTRKAQSCHDPQPLTFSQAQGYEELPGPLKLEELPAEARTKIWSLFYMFLWDSLEPIRSSGPPYRVAGAWADILESKHAGYDSRPFDEWNPEFEGIRAELRHSIETLPFNRVFDLIQFVLRHRACPTDFADGMKLVFSRCRLAYTIDDGQLPTIVPAVTPEEGRAVVEALQTLREAELSGGESHLRNASDCINAGDWAGSVRESIHAVESVARQLDSRASRGLKPALVSLEQRGGLHPALKDAFNKLYGYTSDEQGIRHAALDPADSNVGMDEAVFMLGACASFASYLWRKHVAEEAS
ncbi:MAG: hypothetical protein OXC08_03320 [Thiotrichales bacterium]|nr:hypothetical protein [Thiotrichales bacterium]